MPQFPKKIGDPRKQPPCGCYAVIMQLPFSIASVLMRAVHTTPPPPPPPPPPPLNACLLYNVVWRMTVSPLVHWPGTWRQLSQHQMFGQGVGFRSVCVLCGIVIEGRVSA
jgi:hypothetical protein